MIDHADAINILRLEIGRLRCNAEHPNWASIRKRTLERCANAEQTISYLQSLKVVHA